MKPNDAAKRVLPYIGVYSLDPSANASDPMKRQLQTSDLEFMAGCMTGALGEMFIDGPADLSETRYGTSMRGPEGITLTCTKYSTTVSGVTTWRNSMIGCTCRISGDGNDNEFVSQTQLLNPYMGAPGTSAQMGIVYGDAMMLPAGTDSVIDSVQVPLLFPLSPVTSRQEFRAWTVPSRFGNAPFHSPGSNWFIQQNKPTGQPSIWFAEARFTPTLGYLPIFLLVNPMPQADYALSMRIKIEPPTILATDIGDANTAPDIPIPANWQETIFMPYFTQRFTAHSSFSNKDAKVEIGRQYQRAKEKLQGWRVSGAPAYGHFI